MASVKTKIPKGKKRYAYKYVVAGEYRARRGKDKELELFDEATFYFSEIVEYPLGRRVVDIPLPNGKTKKGSEPAMRKAHIEKCHKYVLKNFYLPPYLKAKYKDYSDLRAFEVTDVVRVVINDDLINHLSGTDIDKMTEPQMLQYLTRNTAESSGRLCLLSYLCVVEMSEWCKVCWTPEMSAPFSRAFVAKATVSDRVVPPNGGTTWERLPSDGRRSAGMPSSWMGTTSAPCWTRSRRPGAQRGGQP